MAIREKTVVSMKMSATCPTHARTEITVRDTGMTVDEPEARGGTNQGPTPTETLLASLAGCTNVILQRVAHSHGVDVQALSVDLEAEFDRRGVQLMEEIDVPFPKIILRIQLTTGASDADVEKVKSDLPRFCPISKVITGAGTQIITEWTVHRG